MCILCRTFGKELDSLWHAGAAVETADTSTPPLARANSVGQNSTGDQQVDGLLSGWKWSGTVTYSFTDSPSDYPSGYGYGEPSKGFGEISAAQKAAMHEIMAQVESFTQLNIDFAGSDNADIRIARSSEANPTAYAYYPDDSGAGEGGDIWFGTSYNYSNPILGSYSYLTHVHELGHALGLKHAHENGGVAGAVPNSHDALEFTVMSYRSYVGGSTGGGYTNENFGYPQSLMMNDIAALQQMYGADFGHNSTDSVYSFSLKTGEMLINGAGQGTPGANRIFLTVWDGGGTDTYKLNNYSTDLTIDLRPGSFSITAGAQRAYLGDGEYAQGNVYNAYLFENDARSYIENAIGGRGDDVLIGNAVDNVLNGNTGSDTMIGGTGNDRYVVESAGDLVDESNGSGADWVIASISFNLGGAQVRGVLEHLTLAGSGDIDGTGNLRNNKLTGNAGDNQLNGGGGNDRIIGGAGNDILNGEAGNDTLTGSTGADVFVFNASMGQDTITDFDAAEGDVIQFEAALFADFADVMAHAAASGSDVVITADALNTLTLESVALASLSADDFRFV